MEQKPAGENPERNQSVFFDRRRHSARKSSVFELRNR